MRAICFIQEVKDADLTLRQQQLICYRALRKLQWPCVMELFAQAGSEAQPISLRPGMVDLMRAAAAGEVDVLMVIDAEHLHCGQAELDGLLMSNLLLLVSHSVDSSIYDEKFKALTKEKADLQAQVDAAEQAARQDQNRSRELHTVLEAIEQQPAELEQYDDELVRRIIEQIEASPTGALAIRFSGMHGSMQTHRWKE